jgi:hypothetical protein
MKCPIDNSELQKAAQEGIEIDYCPQCRGVWLDSGELEKIIERAISEFEEEAEGPYEAPGGYPGSLDGRGGYRGGFGGRRGYGPYPEGLGGGPWEGRGPGPQDQMAGGPYGSAPEGYGEDGPAPDGRRRSIFDIFNV